MSGVQDRPDLRAAPGSAPWLLYGAYGFTGRLIARRAVEAGLSPLVAGRDPSRTRRLARALGLEHVAFGLDDDDALRRALGRCAVVLNAAGPFVHTFRPVVEACLATGTHYLDITGEVEVLERLHRLDAPARAAGIALLPGVGFDVVPTDCAAARAAGSVREPTHLEIAFHAASGPSRGTALTAVEHLHRPPLERRDGRLVEIPGGFATRPIPFADRERIGVAIPWGDISTAFRSTGVPNVRTYIAPGDGRVRWLRLLRRARPLLLLPPARVALRKLVRSRVEGPGEEELARGRSRVWCRARSGTTGEEAEVELTTPNGYTLTARSGVAAVQGLLAGTAGGRARGFLTPSLAFGPDFVERLPGVERIRG